MSHATPIVYTPEPGLITLVRRLVWTTMEHPQDPGFMKQLNHLPEDQWPPLLAEELSALHRHRRTIMNHRAHAELQCLPDAELQAPESPAAPTGTDH